MDRGDFFAAVFPYRIHRLDSQMQSLAEHRFFAYDLCLVSKV